MSRRNGSTYRSRCGSGSGTRNRPIAPGASGPCCHDNPMDHLTILSGSRCGGEGLLEGTLPTSLLPKPGRSGRRETSKAQQINPKPHDGDFSDTNIATIKVPDVTDEPTSRNHPRPAHT